MPVLSLTDFVDIATKAGTPKLTKIRQVRRRPKYNPATDFWRSLRGRIIDAHEQNLGRAHIGGILAGLVDAKKRTAYPPVVDAYSRWWGNKECRWFPPPTAVWTSGSVRVNVNPESGVELDGRRSVVKLYSKADKLAKNKADVILHLMSEVLSDDAPGAAMAVHDIRSRRMIIPSAEIAGIAAMLRGEAAYIAAVWDEL